MALVVPRHRHALLQPHARDDGRAHPRGDPAPGHRLLDHAVRDDGPDAAVARRLPGPRPAPQLRLPAQGAPGAAVAAGRHPLGAQVAPAPRAVPRARRHLPRRHLRRHPPRPGLGDGVDGDDDRLHGPAHPRPGRRRGHGRLLGRPPRAHAAAAAPSERDVLPADRTIDVHFDEFMADDLAMVERVYDLAGQPLDDARRPPWRPSWRSTRGASTGPSTTTWPSSASTRPSGEARSPSTPSASASRSES